MSDSKDALRQRLTPQQYACTQENGTERPFSNEYHDNKEPGLYVDVVSGAPLFLSRDKFDSGSGWPSFTQAVDGRAVVERTDQSHGMVRREVRSQAADSHLGHLFDDGPGPSHRRYCINGASLRFIPASALKAEGHGRFLFDLAPALGLQVATVAAGCFWGVQELFDEQPGVVATQVGYAGGTSLQITYEEVCTGRTGHAEAIQVLFDPKKTSFEALLLFFFRMHDPTTPNRQKNDRGTQYRSAVFYADASQRRAAEQVLAQAARSRHFSAPIVTELSSLSTFVRAEEMHQDYLHKHPSGYRCHVVAPWSLASDQAAPRRAAGG